MAFCHYCDITALGCSGFSRCLLSAAIQEYTLKASQQALPAIERILTGDEEAKAKARKAAEEAATGDVTDFGNAIAKFKKTLRENGSVGPATLFLICRVGSDNESARTLEALNDNTAINDIVLYSKSQLDLKLDESEKEGHVDGYIGWVVIELLRAMELQLIPP
ncbi:hypothetical protein L209DRAFT_743303 [Thermothelomyces heterothallicus CBS 203.75]